MSIRSRQGTSVFKDLLVRSSNSQDTSQCTFAGRYDMLFASPHQHRLINRVQRLDLAAHDRAIHIILHPNILSGYQKTAGPPSCVWSIQIRSIWTSNQLVHFGVYSLYLDLPTFSDNNSRYGYQYELCWTSGCSYHCYGIM